jgi:hypothetical protein
MTAIGSTDAGEDCLRRLIAGGLIRFSVLSPETKKHFHREGFQTQENRLSQYRENQLFWFSGRALHMYDTVPGQIQSYQVSNRQPQTVNN